MLNLMSIDLIVLIALTQRNNYKMWLTKKCTGFSFVFSFSKEFPQCKGKPLEEQRVSYKLFRQVCQNPPGNP